MNELYAEQSRSEVELAQRIDIIDKLRAQMRELEREKRDLQRRYNEQACACCVLIIIQAYAIIDHFT